MPDAIFAHPRLAAIYDAFDGDRADLPAYLDIVGEWAAVRVLDVGCGTGCLAVLLADAGHTVVGADPAGASLAVARAKDPGGRITWLHTDAAALPPLGADGAVLTGNAAQVFLTDTAFSDALRGIHRALRPGGRVAFETRRPEREIWREWAVDTAPVVRDLPGTGTVEQRFEVTGVDLPLVSFRYTYRFRSDATVLTSDSTLRFRGRDEVESALRAEGFRVLDVRGAPDRPGHELVLIAERG